MSKGEMRRKRVEISQNDLAEPPPERNAACTEGNARFTTQSQRKEILSDEMAQIL